MADRYQGSRPYRADDDYDRARNQQTPQPAESDPLAELARLIGQTDPFSHAERDPSARSLVHEPAPDDGLGDEQSADFDVKPGRPSWMQRMAQREEPEPESYPEPAPMVQPQAPHYGQHYGQPHQDSQYPVEHEQDDPYHAAAAAQGYPPGAYDQQPDPSRYDDALYGAADDGQDPRYDQRGGYPAGAYGQGYDEAGAEPVIARKRGGMVTVVVVLALVFVGAAAAYAYRTYSGSPRSGEVPIIKADTGPNKIVPPTQPAADGSGKPIQDRVTTAPGSERIVSREEQPVDVNTAKNGPRVVFPPLTQNPNPTPGGVSAPVMPTSRPAGGSASGNLNGDEPRKVRTLTIRPDQTDGATPRSAAPAARMAAPASTASTTPAANAPMSLSPQAAAPMRTASTSPAPAVAGGAGGYVVQISSQRSEADAQASYRALQGKFPNVLGSRPPLIKRVDLGEKGIYYRAMVGPFGAPDEASQFCGSLKSAGGQCVVQRN